MNEFVEHYLDILSDPAHLAVEVTLMLVVDVLFLGLVWPFIRRQHQRWLERALHRRDHEHQHLYDPDLDLTDEERAEKKMFDEEGFHYPYPQRVAERMRAERMKSQ